MGFWNKTGSKVEENQVIANGKVQVGGASALSDRVPGKPLNQPQAVRPQAPQSAEPQAQAKLANTQPNQDLSAEESLMERYGKLRSALGPGTVIQGKLSFDTPVRIDGKLGGEIFSSRALIVGPQGSVEAKVEVAALIVMGRVTGTIRASERVEVLAGAKVSGDISTPCLVVQDGAVLNLDCKMPSVARMAEHTIEEVAKSVSDLGSAIASKTEETRASVPEPLLPSELVQEEELTLH